jgi:hypothetical protein
MRQCKKLLSPSRVHFKRGKEDLPQSHRDTEKTEQKPYNHRKLNLTVTVRLLLIYLCVSVVTTFCRNTEITKFNFTHSQLGPQC